MGRFWKEVKPRKKVFTYLLTYCELCFVFYFTNVTIPSNEGFPMRFGFIQSKIQQAKRSLFDKPRDISVFWPLSWLLLCLELCSFSEWFLFLFGRYPWPTRISGSGFKAWTWRVFTKSRQKHQQGFRQPFHFHENRRAEPLPRYVTESHLTSEPKGSTDVHQWGQHFLSGIFS